MINVKKTYLPDKEKYKKYVDSIYSNEWITNNVPLIKLFEKRLAKYLNVKNEVSRNIASRVLCLQIYTVLETKQQKLITEIINNEI